MAPRAERLEPIHKALCAAFTLESLERMVALKLGRDLWGYAGKGDKPQVVFELLGAARREGFLYELVIAAREANPESPELAALPPTRGEELRYLGQLIEELEDKARLYSPLQGVAERRQRSKDSLLRPWKGDPDLALLRHRSAKCEKGEQPELRDYDNILTAFGEVKRAALLGDPGSGKSTTLWKLAVELAGRAIKEEAAPLPVLASLGSWHGEEPIEEFLKQSVPGIGGAIQSLNKTRRLVLLLDGLNEVPTATRAAKAKGVLRLQRSLTESTAVIVSCRREDYTGDLDLGLDTLTLEPLSPQRIRAALRQWVTDGGEGPELADSIFWELAGDVGLAGVLERWLGRGHWEDEFWSAKDFVWYERGIFYTDYELWRRHIPEPRSLMRLASNPFLLTMLFQVRVDEGTFPQNRGELFGRFINRLLSRERLLVYDAEADEWRLEPEGKRLLDGLTDLAWGMHREGGGAADFGVLTVAPKARVTAALGGEALLKKALAATILEGDGEIRFRHQLLQEYFTARALQGRMVSMDAAELWPSARWWERSGWEETAVLLAGLHAGDCTGVIRWLAEAQPEVAAQCVVESGAEPADRLALLEELKAAWMPRLTDTAREPEPEGRAAIGRALGRLDLDRRKGVWVDDKGVPEIDWVEIPGGEFVYQGGERRLIETFLIARYPVTNRQFQAFLDAEDGYRNDRWWKGMTNPDRTPVAGSWTEGNHPRERVSWWEAMAFCGWLGHKLGRDVRLPTEWEWERAARGTEGRVYPWGDEYCVGYANINETWGGVGPHNLRRTSAVGIYLKGGTPAPEGVLDLSGNVWEWCLNEYEEPDRMQASGEGSRVLRGGSWGDRRDFARARFRDSYHPYGRNYYIGFRVVCGAPSAEH